MPMGTTGSLSLLKKNVDQTFFVSNSDIIIEQDYSEFLDCHQENNIEIIVLAVLKHYLIPNGTVETYDNGQFSKLKENPDVALKIDSG